MTTPDPRTGVIFERDRHPSAKRFADLLDESRAAVLLCDERLPLSEVLSKEWEVDAHFITYSVHDEDDTPLFVRVSKRSTFVTELLQRGGAIRVWSLVFDYDLPKAEDGSKQKWSEERLGEFVQGLAEADLPSPTWWYSTLHGCRFVYVLEKPVDHLKAEALIREIISRFSNKGIEIDEACKDWTRLFRLPKTVREDSGANFGDDPMFLLLGPSEALDPDSIEATISDTVETFADVQVYAADMPDPDAVKELLVKQGENGRTYPSDLVKTAKTYLSGRDAYDVCFEHKPIDVSKGWNNGVVKIAGQVIGMTARQGVTAEGVFALMYEAIEQLQAEEIQGANASDWFSKSWDIICRMWANEQAQVEAENQEREKSLIQAKAVRSSIVDKIKAARPQDVPEDPEEAEAFVKQRMIASDGRNHWVMRPDASYNTNPVPDSLLVPMIRELGMENVIETNEMRGKAWVPRSCKAILDEHATPIITVKCSSRETTAYIEGAAGYRTLRLPVHKLNPKTKPVFSEKVESWLKALFGDKYDLAHDWLSWSLEVGGPICALNLYGAPGAGKGMLVQGLAECFEGERLNDGRVMGKYNEGLLHTPIINCDEGVPNIKSDEALAIDQAFRTFVSGGSITIRSMYTNPFTASIYPRIIFTSNDRDILRSIVGHRDLTDDDIKAIELRLLSIEIPATAREYLTARGNYGFTMGWVAGKEASRYTLANHIRYLYENKRPSRNGSGRLLVEGEVRTNLVRGLRLRSAGAQTVLKALAKMIESTNSSRHGLHVNPDGRVWVTPSGVVDFVEQPMSMVSNREGLSLPSAGRVLRQFSVAEHGDGKIEKSCPPGGERGRWIEIDMGLLYEETERWGMLNDRICKLLRAQPDGEARMVIIKAHIKDPE